MAKTLEELKTEAEALGITYAPNIKEASLAKKIEAFKAEKETIAPPVEGKELEDLIAEDDGEATVDPEPPVEKPALKPLGQPEAPVVEKKGPKWSGGRKICLGSNSSYPDDEENFPLYRTLKGDKNCYCKAFLDTRVESGFIKVKKGIYVAVDPSKKKK